MLAVHFGAGNIGRGFIGALLSQSGYKVCFVDVQAPLVEALKERQRYLVHLLGERSQTLEVTGVTALDSRIESDRVVKAIAQADIVTTAVGPHILPVIAPIISEGLSLRLQERGAPLNIIACENMLGGSTRLKEEVVSYLGKERSGELEGNVGFPDAAVDRIVPLQSGNDLLEVSVEPFYEWVVDQREIVGNLPPIEGITYVDDLTPYVERKLFTVNTGHAVCAYTGYVLGQKTIFEAMKDPQVRETVSGALEETGRLLIAKHGFEAQKQQDYMEKILARFLNPSITDPVSRVGRAPLRKLGPSDRLVGPALQMVERGMEPKCLAAGIAAALLFHDPEDQEAIQLNKMIEKEGPAKTLQEVGEVSSDSILIPMVEEFFLKWREKSVT
ncbi:mannitol-1-phosphate 5-dehydrogenase [Marinithermofilum abyssi]|uniref:Mannitol-1-phosphate 5-dehydrogenase n=1 Tax=Marinithermofilum abyssi TaxID=1571185 RepID=A0A8J2YAZ1_9BACL|nr:mannitol-1-phosphate 5-dehydrogenase [Marinithermofilum abyssi]GGE24521.1 mannitol-1-phosphate 5-dehydrogenase [Marinithermofilum abyssi]